jgi:hypothetical protein
MWLRGPGMNRSLNRENPDILIVIIAEEQIMRGGGEDKGEKKRERVEGMGPLKPATEMSDTVPKECNVMCYSLSLFLSITLFCTFGVVVWSLSLSSF